MSRAKDIGTRAETAIVRWAREHGFPSADRGPLRGAKDQGDVLLCPGIIVESKSHKSAAAGQVGAKQLHAWLMETDVEAEHAGADFALLVVKRSGTADPGKWWCYMRLGEWLRLTGAHLPLPDPSQPVCMSLASAAAVLRSAGYGTAPEGETL